MRGRSAREEVEMLRFRKEKGREGKGGTRGRAVKTQESV